MALVPGVGGRRGLSLDGWSLSLNRRWRSRKGRVVGVIMSLIMILGQGRSRDQGESAGAGQGIGAKTDSHHGLLNTELVGRAVICGAARS